MRLAKPLVATGEIELMSMTNLPAERPEATPSSPKRTASTSGVSDIIILMLPDTPDVEAVLFGEDGVASGLSAGKTGSHAIFAEENGFDVGRIRQHQDDDVGGFS